MNSIPTDNQIFRKTVQIHAPLSQVWQALTNIDRMKKWMSETEIEIVTDWTVGSRILIGGRLHGIKFENKGTVLEFEPESRLQYSHLSSISRLRDEPQNYSRFDFQLAPVDDQTALSITVSNFPTATIYKHLAFYWNVTLEILKRQLENQESGAAA